MRTVAIVGNGRTRDRAPHDDPKVDIWTMNNHAMLWQRRTTAVFEMHPDALTTDRYGEDYRTWLKQDHPFPIYMHDPHPEIPASVQYPRLPMIGIYKGRAPIRDFYTTTPPYCLALAYFLEYDRVELYGIDMDHEDRQAHRDSVFFWLGYLNAKGIEIYIPETSALMDPWLYPIDTPPPPRKRRLL
jgi:hypothetical protein